MSIEAVRPRDPQLRALIEHSNEAIALISHDGFIVYASPSTQHVTGYETQELEGMAYLSLVHLDDRKQVQAAFTRIHDQWGAFTPIAYRLRSGEGKERWMEGTMTNCLADPTIGAFVVNYRDITACKLQEEALRTAEERYRALVQTTREGIWLIDAQAHILYTNELMTDLLGATSAEIEERGLLAFVFPEDEVDSRARINRSLQGHREQFAVRVRRTDGSERTIHVSTRPVRDATDHIVGVIGICTDNTAQQCVEPVYESSGAFIGSTGVAIDVTERKLLVQEVYNRAKEWETLFEAMTDGILIYDAMGSLRQTNEAARTLLARYVLPEDLSFQIHRRVEQLFPRSSEEEPLSLEHVPSLRILHGEVLTGANTADVVVRTFAGEDLWLNISGTPLRDEQGHITGALAIARDVTERRQLEQRTRHALNVLLEIAQGLVLGTDISPDLPITARLRPLMQRMGELTRAVVGCQRLSFTRVEPETELLHPLAVVGLSSEQEASWWQEQEQQHMHLFESRDLALVERLRANEIILTDLTQPPYRDQPNPYGIRQMLIAPLVSGSQLVGLLTYDYSGLDHSYTPEELALTRAVTELATVVMERELTVLEREEARMSERAAHEAARRMNEFISVSSHELKTPLTSIKGNLQLATRRITAAIGQRRGDDGPLLTLLEGLQMILDRAERQVNVQERLVNDMVNDARIQNEKLELNLVMTDLVTVVHESVDNQRLAAPTRLITFATAVPAVRVVADGERIGQVVNNYLTNALKYSPKDRPVVVRLTVHHQSVRVEVTDEGPGLSTEQQIAIWERFYRVPEVQVQSGTSVGLGLGLYISRKIIEQHQGAVGVESTPGTGSTFWFTLPFLQQEESNAKS